MGRNNNKLTRFDSDNDEKSSVEIFRGISPGPRFSGSCRDPIRSILAGRHVLKSRRDPHLSDFINEFMRVDEIGFCYHCVLAGFHLPDRIREKSNLREDAIRDSRSIAKLS